MAATQFDRPLFAKKPYHIQELASLEDVFDFLDDWPAEKRGDAFEVLIKACRLAAQDVFPLEAVRENVRRFLLREGALANIDEVPLLVGRASDRSPDH